MSQEVRKENKMGVMPVPKLIITMSLPIMASMLVQALYNVVDSIFVSRFDPNGLTAVSLAMPFQMLMIALSTGMGTGINSLVSRRLGGQAEGCIVLKGSPLPGYGILLCDTELNCKGSCLIIGNPNAVIRPII